MRSDVVRLFQTLPHPCGYFAERTAQNIVIDPSAPQLPQIYDVAVQRGLERLVASRGGWAWTTRSPSALRGFRRLGAV